MENALRVLLSVSGSTNAIIHLTAIAGRAGVEVDLKRFNELSDETPVLVDLKPVGMATWKIFTQLRIGWSFTGAGSPVEPPNS